MKTTTYFVLHLVFAFTLSGCTDMGTNVPFLTKPIGDDFSNISDPKARWAAYNLTDYVIEQEMSCFCDYQGVCKVVVRSGTIVDVIRKSDGVSIISGSGQYFKTADQLFLFAESVHPDSVAYFVVEYDPRFGFPRLVYIDYYGWIADEELGYRSTAIEQIVRWY
jgi:hypothetical protein